MNSHSSSVFTAFLLPITLLTLGFNPNNRSGAVVSQPSNRLVSLDRAAELDDKTQFTCATSYHDRLKQKVPTTIAWNPSGKRALVQWVKQMDSYWTPEKRCQEVSQRMQSAYTAGTLKYLTNGKMNGHRVICTAIEVNGDCKNLLMTMRSADKPLKFISELQELFNSRSDGPIEHSSGEPQIYVRVDLNQLWKNAPKVN
jgi:Circadian oscillating protein COP23